MAVEDRSSELASSRSDDRQGLEALCRQQRDIIVMLRRALHTARDALRVQALPDPFERLERDLLQFRYVHRAMYKGEASDTTNYTHTQLVGAGPATNKPHRPFVRHQGLDEIVWELAGILFQRAGDLARARGVQLAWLERLSVGKIVRRFGDR